MHIEPAELKDLPAILEIQKAAFQEELAVYGPGHHPPLAENEQDLRREYFCRTILKAVDNGVLVGSVRGKMRGMTCHVTRLSVHPDHQGRGIGTALMLAVESLFRRARRFELMTGSLSSRNLYLYQKLEYRAYRTEPMERSAEYVYMEKR